MVSLISRGDYGIQYNITKCILSHAKLLQHIPSYTYDNENTQRPGLTNISAFETAALTLKYLLFSFRGVQCTLANAQTDPDIYTDSDFQNVSQQKLYTEL